MALAASVALMLPGQALAQNQAQDQAPDEPEQPIDPTALGDAFPGISVDFEEHFVDVDATVALRNGLLELIACTPDSKEHESLVVVGAAPMHIHAALLLAGAENGNPAMARPANEERTRWVHLPPAGDPIAVFLVIPGEEEGTTVERPISDFIEIAEHEFDEFGEPAPEQEADEDDRDPAEVFDEFVFAGSQVVTDNQGNRHYLADHNGNVISISTFGDEVVCLPFIETRENGQLTWQVNGDVMPPVRTPVKLRLRLIQNPDDEEPHGADE